MLTADRSRAINRQLRELVDRALKDRGVSARVASIDVVGHDGLIRDIRAGRIPSYDRVLALLEYLGVDMAFNQPPLGIDRLDHDADSKLPHHGMARCGLQGWADDKVEREDLPRPKWIDDDLAFWVSASGTSMINDGIRNGDFCLVSPGRAPRVGDRVWVREATNDGKVAIKRLIGLTSKEATLRGWLPEDNDGKVTEYVETRQLPGIAAMHPVVGVYRGRLGKQGVDVRFVPDPRAGQGDDHGGLVAVDLVAESRGQPSGKNYPLALGFPQAWLSRLGLLAGRAVLAGVEDDYLEPLIRAGSVVLLDTRVGDLRGRDILAIRHQGAVLVRRIEQMANGTLIVGGYSPNAETRMIPREQRDKVEFIGRVVWAGTRI